MRMAAADAPVFRSLEEYQHRSAPALDPADSRQIAVRWPQRNPDLTRGQALQDYPRQPQGFRCLGKTHCHARRHVARCLCNPPDSELVIGRNRMVAAQVACLAAGAAGEALKT